ncbi:MAG: TolC family protein [Bryobacteraceae bacterium]
MKPLKFLLAAGLAAPVCAQEILTLAEAERLARQNHPRITASVLRARAADASTAAARSAYFPTIAANLTGVQVDEGSRIGAGNITTSRLDSRFAGGVNVTQLLTDFGRTGSLTESARSRAGAESENASFTRAQVLLNVRQAYFNALLSQTVLKIARDTVASRQLTLKQINALFQSDLKSSLDVSFAEVNVSAAELVLFRAENDIQAALSELSAAVGLDAPREFRLAEEDLPPPLPPVPDTLVQQALQDRPDLASLRLRRQAELSFAEAERKLKLPSVTALGVAGSIPLRDNRDLRGHYGGVGVNVNFPIFNGHLFSARQTEAALRAQALAEEVRGSEIRIRNDVRVAWLNAQTAWRRLDVTARLVEQAGRSGRLAQARYDLGLASIVELNQAQLNQTAAEIENANAKYEYQIRRSILNYESGTLR